MNGIYAYRLMSALAFVGAFVEPTARRFVWTLCGCAFYVAADKWKDVEKIKRKARDETILQMREEIIEKDRAGMNDYVSLVIQKVATAHENAWKQMSVFVKDASPTRNR